MSRPVGSIPLTKRVCATLAVAHGVCNDDAGLGVGDHLVMLNGLLRPLVHRAWSAMVAQLNDLDESHLESFLFGMDRIALAAVRPGLLDLQDGRCFYCGDALGRSAEVDHFIPWAQYPDDGIGNLVVADAGCNGAKRDFLAAGEHVRRWRQRNLAEGLALVGIADSVRWETHPEETLGGVTRLSTGLKSCAASAERAAVAARAAVLPSGSGGVTRDAGVAVVNGDTLPQRLPARCSRRQAGPIRAASCGDREIPASLVSQSPRREHERSGEALSGQLRISGQNLAPGRAAGSKLEQEVDTEARPPNARFAAEHLGVAHNPFIGHRGTSPAGVMMPHVDQSRLESR